MDLDNEQFNITDTAPEPESDNFPWVEATQIASIAGLVITILGFLLNYFCFITAGQLPESSSARLMKYLAVWDSISSMQDGVFNLGLKAFGVNLASFTVSSHDIIHARFRQYNQPSRLALFSLKIT